MISIVQKYLAVNQYADQKENFTDIFQSHPNFPSLFAITDTFDILGIENIALKVPKEQILELPDYFLAMYNDEFVLVQKNTTSIKIQTEKNEKKTLTFEAFLDKWDGIVVAIEPNESSDSESLGFDFKKVGYSLPAIVVIALSFGWNQYNLQSILLLLLSIMGLVVAVFIIREKLGFKNEIVAKFCNMNSNASCDSVIKSKQGNLNSWIDFSDLPLLFFGVNTLVLILQPVSSALLIGIISWASLPIIVYSVVLQKFQLKKWCLLCLVVSLLLLLQCATIGMSLSYFQSLTTANILFYSAIFIAISSLWLILKPALEQKIKVEKEVSELKKFKRNYSIFKVLSKEITIHQGLEQLEGLQFGNVEAEAKLTIILSPSCGHCHKAFKDGLELVSQFPDRFFLNVLFNINPENSDNPYKVVVESLLAIHQSKPEKAKEAIFDWHIKNMELEVWKQKWAMYTLDMKVNQQMHLQYQWCLQNDFNFTPIKIINTKLFPNEYDITDMKYFISAFSEDKVITQSV